VGVAALILAVAAAATGWGILLAAWAKTPHQVSSLGTALMLLFGILGGTFISTAGFTGLMDWLSRITPHAWALDGFTTLSRGGTLGEIWTPLIALLTMAALLFGLAVLVFQRRWKSVI
jgi:ABC-2 type transport system permease protein